MAGGWKVVVGQETLNHAGDRRNNEEKRRKTRIQERLGDCKVERTDLYFRDAAGGSVHNYTELSRAHRVRDWCPLLSFRGEN